MSSFSWSDFLRLARSLSTGGDEASWRSASSRAYYAAFHPAKCYVHSKYDLEGRGSEHERTWRALTLSSIAEEQLLGNIGDDLKRLRVHADYQTKTGFSSQQALQSIASATKLLSRLEALRKASESNS